MRNLILQMQISADGYVGRAGDGPDWQVWNWGPLAEEVDGLKAEPGRDLIAFGGAGFASALIANDLVDEYQFYVNPVTLREGLSIFKKRGVDSNLDLREAEGYPCGIVVIRYSPRGRASEKAKV